MKTNEQINFRELVISECKSYLRNGVLKPLLLQELTVFKSKFNQNISNLEAMELLLDYYERN